MDSTRLPFQPLSMMYRDEDVSVYVRWEIFLNFLPIGEYVQIQT